VGKRWEVTPALEGSGAQCLALDPHHPGTAYVGCRGGGLWRSTDGGVTFEDSRLPDADVFSVAVSQADGAVYAGCEPSKLYVSRDGGDSWRELEALRRIPSAPSWSFPPRPWTSHVRAIAPSPHEPELLLVGIELGGLMRSGDGGESFEDHRPGAQRDVHALAWHPRANGRAYEAGGGGAAWSFDAGHSWQAADRGRDRHYTWALAVDPADPECWYVSAAPGPRQAHGDEDARAGLYRWRGQGPWQAIGEPVGRWPAMPYALTAADGVLYAGLRDGTILESEDGGESWAALALSGRQPRRVLALAVAAGA
jgi:photosystem II stability/assembly factor-like uncharacterized protein